MWPRDPERLDTHKISGLWRERSNEGDGKRGSGGQVMREDVADDTQLPPELEGCTAQKHE